VLLLALPEPPVPLVLARQVEPSFSSLAAVFRTYGVLLPKLSNVASWSGEAPWASFHCATWNQAGTN
jgi:hypothetical protein